MYNSVQSMEARCRELRAEIEASLFPQLWVSSLIELAGLEHKLAATYDAQRNRLATAFDRLGRLANQGV